MVIYYPSLYLLVWKHSEMLLVRTVKIFTPWDYCKDNMNLDMESLIPILSYSNILILVIMVMTVD